MRWKICHPVVQGGLVIRSLKSHEWGPFKQVALKVWGREQAFMEESNRCQVTMFPSLTRDSSALSELITNPLGLRDLRYGRGRLQNGPYDVNLEDEYRTDGEQDMIGGPKVDLPDFFTPERTTKLVKYDGSPTYPPFECS